MIKYFIFLISFCISNSSLSKETIYTLDLTNSLYNYHYSKSNAEKYENKVSEDGRLINNPLYGITLSWQHKKNPKKFKSFSIFSGKDSIDSDMNGFSFTWGRGSLKESGWQYGFIWGLYFYDEDVWEERYLKVKNGKATTSSPSWLRTKINEDIRGVNMILGLELKRQWKINDTILLKSKNVITPQIINISVAVGFNF